MHKYFIFFFYYSLEKESIKIYAINDTTPIPIQETKFWNNNNNVKLLQSYLTNYLVECASFRLFPTIKFVINNTNGPHLTDSNKNLENLEELTYTSETSDIKDYVIFHIDNASTQGHTVINVSFTNCELLAVIMYFLKRFETFG